jgi:hypothetical protein
MYSIWSRDRVKHDSNCTPRGRKMGKIGIGTRIVSESKYTGNFEISFLSRNPRLGRETNSSQ